MRRAFVFGVIALLTVAGVPGLVVAEAPANDAFQRTWERTDQPVLEGNVSRTWMWGPEAFTGAIQEAYAESPGGERTVQYFDKSRMEDSAYRADGPPWDVTNGLLVVELITGRMQAGDDTFEERSAARTNVVGDQDADTQIQYADLSEFLDQEPGIVGEPIHTYFSWSIAGPGNAGEVVWHIYDAAEFESSASDEVMAFDVRAAHHVAETDHVIAAPFWEFMNSEATVYESGNLTTDALFPNPYYATGLPITEPNWTQARVGGTTKWVLLQCFERRCLTYTPDNPEGWQVEAGNVGQHYYTWRYGDGDADPPTDEAPAELECQALGYPCSLADTPPEVIDQIFNYGETMQDMLANGQSMSEVHAWIEGQPDIVEVFGDERGLIFRVEGGTPAWLYNVLDSGDQQTQSLTSHVPRSSGSAQPPSPQEVVGPDLDSDGMTDERPKRAIILSPFKDVFEPWDEGDELQALLDGTRGYRGNVVYKANTKNSQGVELGHFETWRNYDVIHVSTHGSERCRPTASGIDIRWRCPTFINSGVEINDTSAAVIDAYGAYPAFEGLVPWPTSKRTTLALSVDFFRATYPSGLDDAIIYFSACETFGFDTALVDHLKGDSSIVLGWSDTVYSDHSADSALLLYQTAIEEGTPIGMLMDGQTGAVINDTPTLPQLRYAMGGADLRIRETVTQMHPLTEEPLSASHPVPIIGEYGDGIKDDYLFMIDVEGVNSDPAEFIVHIRVNGVDLEETFTLADGEQIGGGLGSGAPVYRLRDQVTLEHDVASPGEQLEVMVWIELPEGGETKQTLSASLDNPQLLFQSRIEYESEAGSGSSHVEGQVLLDYSGGNSFTANTSTLDHLDFDYELPSASPCRVTRSVPIDGELEVVSVVFSDISRYVPEYAILKPKGVTEEFTVYCPGVGSETAQTQAFFIELWEGFHSGSFGHDNERVEAQGAFRIEDWTANGGKIYERAGDYIGYKVREYTEIRILSP